MDQDEAPRISALFVVVFDQKVGYTISWKRTAPGIDIDGVEFKSLPSGLHGVSNDLVYFIHQSHAGVTAFVKGEADASARNARFVAVGALVPLSYGRLGRGWLHAQELRQLGEQIVKDKSDTAALEAFWKRQGSEKTNKSDTPRRESLQDGFKRKRALSDATMSVRAGCAIARDHPALAMPQLLDLFGPLLFPLYRAALLRKRILLLGTAPVQETCNFIYILSVLSGIPHALDERLPSNADALLRIQPLFSVGVHDISVLSEQKGGSGWLACTTDGILGEKPQLYDFRVELPAADKRSGILRQWPKVRTPDGRVVKATQRDLRRYRLLRHELNRLRRSPIPFRDDEEGDLDDYEFPLMGQRHNIDESRVKDKLQDGDGEYETVEPMSWTAMAYNGFMWWASAGEQMEWEEGEASADYELLNDLPDLSDIMAVSPPSPGRIPDSGSILQAQTTATIITAFFHRYTTRILQTLADIVEHADDETEEGVEENAITMTPEDIRQMGLHTWSESDREFVMEAMKLYFGREVAVTDTELRMCGMRIC